MDWHGVTDEQWAEIEKHLPKRKPKPKGGRPSVDDRKCFDGIIWILWESVPWSKLPKIYGSKSTVHRRLIEWYKSKVLFKLWRAFLDQLKDRQIHCLLNGLIFREFVPSKKSSTALITQGTRKVKCLWFWQMERIIFSEYFLPR